MVRQGPFSIEWKANAEIDGPGFSIFISPREFTKNIQTGPARTGYYFAHSSYRLLSLPSKVPYGNET